MYVYIEIELFSLLWKVNKNSLEMYQHSCNHGKDRSMIKQEFNWSSITDQIVFSCALILVVDNEILLCAPLHCYTTFSYFLYYAKTDP